VRNMGETDAAGVTVDVYNGNPDNDQFVLGLTLNEIQGGGYGTADFTMGLDAAAYDLHVVVDKQNDIDEASTANNSAVKSITVLAEDFEGIDLSVAESSISIEPVYPIDGEPVSITATVSCSGDRDAANVLVQMYDGEISESALLVSNTFENVYSGYGAELVYNGTLSGGSHTIIVVVDAEDTVVEISNINNTSAKALTVQHGTETVDIDAASITFEPQNPTAGEDVKISCTVNNAGSVAVNNITVRVYDGDPDGGAALLLLEHTIPQLGPGNNGLINVVRNTTGWGGSHDIYLVVDPENEVNEVNENNNRHAGTLIVPGSGQALPDLKIIPGSLEIDPAEPATGDNATIVYRVTNSGGSAAGEAAVAFSFDGVVLETDTLTDFGPNDNATIYKRLS
ncbi:MAG: hypothetical protein GY868_02340, partial [Deltaproteobacteria bacterium]|nr:hypothetical protein [Deltaproteobacteria bacterium]